VAERADDRVLIRLFVLLILVECGLLVTFWPRGLSVKHDALVVLVMVELGRSEGSQILHVHRIVLSNGTDRLTLSVLHALERSLPHAVGNAIL